MIHFAVDDKTKGNCEQFLSEGIALYYEEKYTNFLWDIKERMKNRLLLPKTTKRKF